MGWWVRERDPRDPEYYYHYTSANSDINIHRGGEKDPLKGAIVCRSSFKYPFIRTAKIRHCVICSGTLVVISLSKSTERRSETDAYNVNVSLMLLYRS